MTEARLGPPLACAEWRNITADGPDGGTSESDEHRQIARLSYIIDEAGLRDACEGNCKQIGPSAAHNLVPLCDLKSRKGLAYLLRGIADTKASKFKTQQIFPSITNEHE